MSSDVPTPSRSLGSTLEHVLQLLRRRWPWLASMVILTCGFAAFFSSRQEQRFSASSSVYLSQQNLANALNGIPSSQAFDTSTLQRNAATQAGIAKTVKVAALALKRVPEATGMTPDELLSDTTVEPNPDADLMTFTVTSGSRELASRLSTAFASSYIEYRRSLDTRSITLARRSVDRQISKLERARDTRSTLYESLVDKSQQLQAVAALQTSNATVVQRAFKTTQVQPRVVRNLLLAAVLGALLGALLMILREQLDNRLSTEEDVERALNMPLVARAGPPLHNGGADARAVMLASPSDPSAEAYRLLRSNLDLSLLTGEVLLVTSALASEGKSTTAANLAAAWARVGKNVLVMDFDLRKPTQHKLLGVPRAGGLSDVVRGSLSLEDAIEQVPLVTDDVSVIDTGSLFLLQPGTPPPDVGEFLALKQVEEIVRTVNSSQRYDVVVIDSPPALLFGDTTILASIADALLVVARLGVLERRQATEMSRAVERWPIRRLGFLLSGSHDSMQTYGYYASDSSDTNLMGASSAAGSSGD